MQAIVTPYPAASPAATTVDFTTTLATTGLASEDRTIQLPTASSSALECQEWNCTCQGFSDVFGTYPNHWHHAPARVRLFWLHHHCNSWPSTFSTTATAPPRDQPQAAHVTTVAAITTKPDMTPPALAADFLINITTPSPESLAKAMAEQQTRFNANPVWPQHPMASLLCSAL